MSKCDKECGYTTPKNLKECPRCGKPFDRKEAEREARALEAGKDPYDQSPYRSPTTRKK